MDIQVGDIVLYKRNRFWNLFSKLVSEITHSKYTHCSMVISDSHLIEANWYKLSNIIKFDYKPRAMEIWRIKGSLNQQQKQIILSNSLKQLGKFYDYPQLVEYVHEYIENKKFFHNPLNSKKLLICSELIDNIYQDSGIDLVPFREEGNVTPGDLPLSPILERVY